jgi:hypothetical protein
MCAKIGHLETLYQPSGISVAGRRNQAACRTFCAAGGMTMSASHIVVAAIVAAVALAGPLLLPGKHRAHTASVEQMEPRGS